MNINASLFVQLVVFLLGAWITMKYIWPPLIRAIENRQKKIAEGLRAADLGQSALVEASQKQQAIETEARAQAMTIEANKQAADIVEQAKQQAEVEANRIVQTAKDEAAQEMQRAKEALRDQVAQLAIAGAEQILKREVNADIHKDMLDQLKAKL
jgi:F-type H+-transporting ATPase subunit b